MNDTPPLSSAAPSPREREIHLRDYLRVIIRRKATVLTFLVLVVLTVTIISFTATPLYTASSQVLIEMNYGAGGLENTNPYRYYDPDFLTTQFEIIRSANVARRVVKNLQLDTRYKQYFIEETEEDSPLVSLRRKITDILTGLFSQGEADESEDKSAADADLPEIEELSDADIIAGMIQEGLSIKPVSGTKTVYINYTDPHPAMAKLVLDAVVQAYRDELLEIKLSSRSYALQWMTAKAEQERKKLDESERALQKYMREHDLVTVENRLAVYPQKLAEFSKQLSEAQAEQKEYEALYGQIKAIGKDYKNIETIPIFAENKVLQNLRDKVYTAEQKIKELSKKYGYKHPLMIQAKAERDLLLKEQRSEIDRIIEATRNSYELARSREANMKKLLAESKQEMLDINESFTQYTIMKREVEMNRALYDNLTSSIKTTTVTEQSQDVKVWVVEEAQVPLYPSSPRKKRNIVLGLLLGLFGGIGLAFFLEYLDNTVRGSEELEQRFDLKVLGSIEQVTGKEESIEIALRKNPLSPLAESYRLIRSGLLLSAAGHPPRTILITSMGPKEGKTATTANLARILAQSDRKVLIIDCDMRRPRMHSLFRVPNMYGLSNYLAGNGEGTLVQTIAGEDVDLICAGTIPPNPAELLNSAAMQDLVDEMLARYDFLLFDSPPVQSVTDSLVISRLAEGTLLVVRQGKTTLDALENGIRKMREVHARLLGIVLNGVNRKGADAGYYGYYEYYSKEN